MADRFAVLPCNGLDKAMGPLTREVALSVLAATGGELICPVLAQRVPARYAKIAAELPLLVVDGCATRCASRLATDQGWKVSRRLQIAEAAKAAGVTVEDSLTPGARGQALCRSLVQELLKEEHGEPEAVPTEEYSAPVDYDSFTHDKFVFRVPRTGYLFNENDCWARINGNRARVGISDYMQQQLSDILFCSPAEPGAPVEQFGEAGTVESTKAVFEVVSPVSGKVIAINAETVERPELINEDPYEQGWIVELELADLAAEKEFLLDGPRYLELMQKKVAEYKE